MSSSSWRKSERVRRARGERILFTNDDVGGVSSERRGREREEKEESHFFLWIEEKKSKSNSLSASAGVFFSCLVASSCLFSLCPLFLNKNSLEFTSKKEVRE